MIMYILEAFDSSFVVVNVPHPLLDDHTTTHPLQGQVRADTMALLKQSLLPLMRKGQLKFALF